MNQTTETTETTRTVDQIKRELATAKGEVTAAKGSTAAYKVKQARVKQAKARVRMLSAELAVVASEAIASGLNGLVEAAHGGKFSRFAFVQSGTLTAAGEPRVLLTTAAGIPLTEDQATRVVALFAEFGVMAPKPVAAEEADAATDDDAAPASAK